MLAFGGLRCSAQPELSTIWAASESQRDMRAPTGLMCSGRRDWHHAERRHAWPQCHRTIQLNKDHLTSHWHEHWPTSEWYCVISTFTAKWCKVVEHLYPSVQAIILAYLFHSTTSRHDSRRQSMSLKNIFCRNHGDGLIQNTTVDRSGSHTAMVLFQPLMGLG